MPIFGEIERQRTPVFPCLSCNFASSKNVIIVGAKKYFGTSTGKMQGGVGNSISVEHT